MWMPYLNRSRNQSLLFFFQPFVLNFVNRKMPTCCSVYGCHSTSRRNPELMFHAYPKNKHRREQWALTLRIEPSPNSKVCQLHFKDDDYRLNQLGDRWLLKDNVCPSQLLPVQPNTEYCAADEHSYSIRPRNCVQVDHRIASIKKAIATHPNFPIHRSLHRDVFPLFRDVKLLQTVITILIEIIERKAPDATVIAGIEAKGFLFGPLIGIRLGLPFIPIRKAGRLPGETLQTSYQFQYGIDILEVQADAIASGSRVVIVDDLLVTGGSMRAACHLIESAGGCVSLCLTLIELINWKGQETLTAPFASVLQY